MTGELFYYFDSDFTVNGNVVMATFTYNEQNCVNKDYGQEWAKIRILWHSRGWTEQVWPKLSPTEWWQLNRYDSNNNF